MLWPEAIWRLWLLSLLTLHLYIGDVRQLLFQLEITPAMRVITVLAGDYSCSTSYLVFVEVARWLAAELG